MPFENLRSSLPWQDSPWGDMNNQSTGPLQPDHGKDTTHCFRLHLLEPQILIISTNKLCCDLFFEVDNLGYGWEASVFSKVLCGILAVQQPLILVTIIATLNFKGAVTQCAKSDFHVFMSRDECKESGLHVHTTPALPAHNWCCTLLGRSFLSRHQLT